MVNIKDRCLAIIEDGICDGSIDRGTECQFCGDKHGLELHVVDYAKPMEHSWVCPTCYHCWENENTFELNFFRADTPMDVIRTAMEKYFMTFHIETTNHMSTYVGVAFK